MNSIYANNQEVTTFITKAQNKIADLTTLLVERGGELSPLNLLCQELIDFIETLDNPLTTWPLEDVIRWIHEYSYRANLGELSYLNIYGYNTTLINNVLGTSTTTTSNITDFELAVNDLISRFPHNSLVQIQGGATNERYHLTKAMYDFLNNQVNPIIPSTVNLTLNTTGTLWPSGYYELGVAIPAVNLVGSIVYGTDKQALYFEYLRGSSVVGSRVNNPTLNAQPNSISDTLGITSNTTYSFNASFNGGLLSNSKSIIFRQPMYYGIINSNQQDASHAQMGTKDVRDRGDMNLTFNLPVGNTSPSGSEPYFKPYLFIPSSWGKFTSAIVSTFDFAGDWDSTPATMQLADGTTQPGLLLTYKTQIEGSVTFKFIW